MERTHVNKSEDFDNTFAVDLGDFEMAALDLITAYSQEDKERSIAKAISIGLSSMVIDDQQQ